MRPTEHRPFQKFQAIDMPLYSPIAPRQREGRPHGRVITTNAIDKAASLCHTARFCSCEPSIQCLCLAFFEEGHEFLAQEIDRVQFGTSLADLLDLLLLNNGQLLNRSFLERRPAKAAERVIL